MGNKKNKISPETLAAKKEAQMAAKRKKMWTAVIIAAVAVAVVAGAGFGWHKYRTGGTFGVDSVNPSTVEVTANHARLTEKGGYLTVEEGQKMEVVTDFKGKGGVHMFVYPNMVAQAEQATEAPTEEVTEEATAEASTEATESASEQATAEPETPEYKLIMEKTFTGKGEESFELEPGDYFLYFRVDKKATTGTMTVTAK